ncbi:MAG: lipid-A-disaccharide synthase [Bacteroidia bacterium]
MKIFLLAGEASGDLHGSHLVAELKQLHPDWEIIAWGGPLMQKAGARILSDYRDRAYMGLWEVLRHLRSIRRYIQQAQHDIDAEQPNALVFIDNPGFNLRVWKSLKAFSGKAFYYIAPKAWAWNARRAQTLVAFDAVYGILPFEPDWFAQQDVRCTYIGNPLMDQIPEQAHQESKEPILALLPGSRKQEVESLLPLMLEAARSFPEYRVVVAATSALDPSLYQQLIPKGSAETHFDLTYELLAEAHMALVASGTATLETALFQVPQVVVYKTSALTYWAAKLFVKIPYISLVNLVAQKEVVPELIQHHCKASGMVQALRALEKGNPARDTQLREYQAIRKALGGPGVNKRLADSISKALSL